MPRLKCFKAARERNLVSQLWSVQSTRGGKNKRGDVAEV
jgi:hypothetical protein